MILQNEMLFISHDINYKIKNYLLRYKNIVFLLIIKINTGDMCVIILSFYWLCDILCFFLNRFN